MSIPINTLITGIPRSGTTLVTSIVDSLSNTVALNEPLSHATWPMEHPEASAEDYVTYIKRDFEQLRKSILNTHSVYDWRDEKGNPVTDYYKSKNAPKLKPLNLESRHLTPGFRLAVKHNAPYLAVLDKLAKPPDFTLLVVIRNPIDVIYSWRSLNIPISRGKLPHGIFYWPELKDITDAKIPLIEKQVRIYDLLCKKIAESQQALRLIRYESLIQNDINLPALLGGSYAQNIIPVKATSKPLPSEYITSVKSLLASHAQYYAHFYPDLN